MDEAYFMSKRQLLQWLNDLLGTNYTKVEEIHNGAAVSLVIEKIHPGTVKVSKLHKNTKKGYEISSNYKLLQAAFLVNNIDKDIDVQKLSKGGYQDNLEFLQWTKAYFDRTYNGEVIAQPRVAVAPGKARVKPVETQSAGNKENKMLNHTRCREESAEQKAEISALSNTVKELQVTVEELEKERDFYFGKLREVEIFCQTNSESEMQNADVIKDVSAILYANDDAEAEDINATEAVEVEA
ncbi:hypothetical protein NDN08_000915 [Rhodosorus marinus]|uniref:Calponin-homology (CH) domain-containing protein n=1 Tax=Rhodosorus marinus TaxID=101924 RepID=A0AAV8USD3_9RHOD|nr:hypothetical protein NDN08_000915 [Rhodosorus marinus]